MTTAKARREEIYHLAVTTGLASVEELSRHFRVTASTIRRDLAQLNEQGKLARTYGGAMALGHPLGSSGARLLTTLLHVLEDDDQELGLVTMCCAGGLGTATVLQRL